jgi:predicted ATPase
LHDELAALCADKNIAQEMLWARPVWGWALFETGQRERGLAEVATGLGDQATSHNTLLRPYYLQLHADLLLRSSRMDEAEALLAEASVIGRTTDQQMFAAEWHRLRGQALLARDAANIDEARAAFDNALEVARWQGAKLFEGRAREALAGLTAARKPDSSHSRQNATA